MRRVRLVDAASSRGGRRFEAVMERELYFHAEQVAASLPGPPGDVILIPEMPSPLGLPDFVALVGGEGWLVERSRLAVPPILSEIDATLLSALGERRLLSEESIASRLGWTPDQVGLSLSRLVRAGAAARSVRGSAVARAGMKPEGLLYAIEVKVKDWRRAQIQGRGYRTWANNYVVVLGGVGTKASTRAKAEHREDGAGLYTEDGWIVRPRKRTPSSARRAQGFEYVYAALASDPALGSHKHV